MRQPAIVAGNGNAPRMPEPSSGRPGPPGPGPPRAAAGGRRRASRNFASATRGAKSHALHTCAPPPDRRTASMPSSTFGPDLRARAPAAHCLPVSAPRRHGLPDIFGFRIGPHCACRRCSKYCSCLETVSCYSL
eukprot:366499-Chlamydomonas_euryale.AAC.1